MLRIGGRGEDVDPVSGEQDHRCRFTGAVATHYRTQVVCGLNKQDPSLSIEDAKHG